MEARVVKEYATETPLLTIGNEQMLAANIGSYVVIRQANIAVLAMVFKMREQDRFEQGERLSDRFFSLIPVGELRADETFIRSVRHYPTPGAKVYAVGLAEINAIFSQFRSYDFFIGQLFWATHLTRDIY